LYISILCCAYHHDCGGQCGVVESMTNGQSFTSHLTKHTHNNRENIMKREKYAVSPPAVRHLLAPTHPHPIPPPSLSYLIIFYLLFSFSGSHAGSIVQGPNGLQSNIKMENSSGNYYSNCYTPPGPDHSSVLMSTGSYSKSTLTYIITRTFSFPFSLTFSFLF
jgi:hypothetical protein